MKSYFYLLPVFSKVMNNMTGSLFALLTFSYLKNLLTTSQLSLAPYLSSLTPCLSNLHKVYLSLLAEHKLGNVGFACQLLCSYSMAAVVSRTHIQSERGKRIISGKGREDAELHSPDLALFPGPI